MDPSSDIVDAKVCNLAYFSSDEDEEDTKALLFLPIAPEIEEPEEGWPDGQPPVSLSYHRALWMLRPIMKMAHVLETDL